MKENNLLYVTWGEVIIENGIFKNQVVEQLKLIKKERKDLNVFLLSGVPLGNRKFLKQPSQFLNELKKIKASCAENGINFSYRLIYVPSPWFYTPASKIGIYDASQVSFLKNFIRRNNIALVHCRSYTPTRLMLKVREQLKSNPFKLIFDTRGNFPEEGLLKNHLSEQDYAFWKEKEKTLFKESDAVVNVSDTFTDYVNAITDNPEVHTIYTSTNLVIFHRLPEAERKEARDPFNVTSSDRVLTYLGEISDTGWHQKRNLFNLYRAFKGAFANAKLLLVTSNTKEELMQSFTAEGFDANELIVVKGRTQQEVNKYLNIADYASLPFKKITNELDKTLGYTMIASKTGEYLATGLPVIVNNKIGAASKLVSETQTGVTYEMDNEASVIPSLKEFEANKEIVIERCVQTAKRFDAKTNAEKYLAIYDKLLQ